MKEKITLTVSYENHTDVVLTNKNGDTYTSRSEELIDFLLSSEENDVSSSQPITPEQIQEQAEKYANSIVPNPDKYDAPYRTTVDRHNDITDAWEACAKWMQERDSKQFTLEDVSEALRKGVTIGIRNVNEPDHKGSFNFNQEQAVKDCLDYISFLSTHKNINHEQK